MAPVPTGDQRAAVFEVEVAFGHARRIGPGVSGLSFLPELREIQPMSPSAIRELLAHRPVYHFTDEENLPLIDRLGLLSSAELARQNLPTKHGGDMQSRLSDVKLGRDDYVRLCVVPNHPMHATLTTKGRLMKWIRVDNSALLLPGVMYCAKMANANDSVLIDAESAIREINFELMLKKSGGTFLTDEDFKLYRKVIKAEILVPRHVPRRMLIL